MTVELIQGQEVNVRFFVKAARIMRCSCPRNGLQPNKAVGCIKYRQHYIKSCWVYTVNSLDINFMPIQL